MSHQPFLDWLVERKEQRPFYSLNSLSEETAVVVVDLLEGFCRDGALASPAVGSLVPGTLEFLTQAHAQGVRHFLFPSDSHAPDSLEFQAFPPHCLTGSKESQLVSELLELEFSHLFERIDKASVSSLVGTNLVQALKERELRTIVCTGDCTDLCLYHLAVGLRFEATSQDLPWQIVVPQNLVATYDLPLAVAQGLGVLPHPGDLMGDLFLYHLELNGVAVVAGFE